MKEFIKISNYLINISDISLVYVNEKVDNFFHKIYFVAIDLISSKKTIQVSFNHSIKSLAEQELFEIQEKIIKKAGE